MGLAEAIAPDGTATSDFPEGLRTRINTYAAACFFEYVVHRGHTFLPASAPANTVFDGAYFGKPAGQNLYVLTDHTFTLYPAAFDRGMAPRTAYLKPCHLTFYSPGVKTFTVDVDVADYTFRLPKDYFLEFSADDGSRAIKAIQWQTKVTDQNKFRVAPKVTLGKSATSGPLAGGTRTTQVTVRDTVSGASAAIDFGYGGDKVRRPATNVRGGQQGQIRAFLDGVFAEAALRTNAMRVGLVVEGAGGATSDDNRLQNVMNEVRTQVTGEGRLDPIFYHAGLHFPGGNPTTRSGALDVVADVHLVDWDEFRIVLPAGGADEPGTWVGAEVAADVDAGTLGTCKVTLTIQLEPSRSSLGLAGQGAQAGENLFVWEQASPNCSGDTLMHELAHSMGMTVMRGWNKPPPGLPYPKTVDEDDADTGHKGHIYDNAHGGSGSHCANGLSDGDKAAVGYDTANARCGMLDNGPSSDPSPFTGYCAQCQEYIKARDLSDITRSFK
jgi:hypothetical protein